jgi:cation diffusion facilitator CzcD-associated flavoprotein CzcO
MTDLHTLRRAPEPPAPLRQAAIVIGAGPAGLATAACLGRLGLQCCVLERSDSVGASWRAHYRRLHLHTVKELSALPGLPFPAQAPRYVPREQVVQYLEGYAEHFGIRPLFGVTVRRIEPLAAGAGWAVACEDGRRVEAPHVIVASGANAHPRRPGLPGEDVYQGIVLHSHAYRDPAPFAGQRVLVVGMGNTGAEIALDLCEAGVEVALSVRSAVNIVHCDVLGRPTQRTSILLGRLPPRLGHALTGWLRDLTVGDLSRWGLRTPRTSPLAQLREEGRTPVIDGGTLARIRAGDIRVHPGIERLQQRSVRFVDGTEAPFDTLVLATGYEAGLQALMPGVDLDLDARGLPREAIGRRTRAGLHFTGFDLRQPGGLLRTIAQQAQEVARAVARDGG